MSPKPTIQHVIFDLGGVVVDWNPDAIVRVVFNDLELQDRVKQTIFQHPDWLEMDRGTLMEAEAIPRFVRRAGYYQRTCGRAIAYGRPDAASQAGYTRSDPGIA